MPSNFEAEDVLQLRYGLDNGHERLLVQRTTPAAMESRVGEAPESDSVWWVVTPHCDVFPEEVSDHSGPGSALPGRSESGSRLPRRFEDGVGGPAHVQTTGPVLAPRLGYVWKVLNEDGLIEKDEAFVASGWQGMAAGRCALAVSGAGSLCLEQVC